MPTMETSIPGKTSRALKESDGTDPSKTAQRKCDGSELVISFRVRKMESASRSVLKKLTPVTTSGFVLTTMIRLVQSLRLILVDLPLVTYLPTIV